MKNVLLILLFDLLIAQEFVIVLTGIYNYFVHFFMFIWFYVHGYVPGRARRSSCLELVLMYSVYDYSNVIAATSLEKYYCEERNQNCQSIISSQTVQSSIEIFSSTGHLFSCRPCSENKIATNQALYYNIREKNNLCDKKLYY